MNKTFILSSFLTKSIFTFLLCCFSILIYGQNVSPQKTVALFQHLNEVNQEWSKQDFPTIYLQTPIAFKSDKERIQLHLQLVEKILRERNVSHLTSQQVANRLHHLGVLKSYWQRGLFPKNKYHTVRQPYFVDDQGTACAVGYLVLQSGATDIVEKIKTENNYAYIRELQLIYPELEKWADENGFGLEELAWIQPGYPAIPQEYYPIGGGGGVNGKVNIMKTNYNGSLLILAGDFSEVDGIEANSIITYDGANWQTLGNGVEGEIFAVTTDFLGRIFIGGDFTLIDNPEYSNVAYWDGTSWQGLQKGEMDGSIYTIIMKDGLYVGGDFLNINNQPLKYLAKINSSINGFEEDWNNYATRYIPGSGYDTIMNALTVDGPVFSFERIGGLLLIGGNFDMTAPNVLDSTTNQIFTNLAYWNSENWVTGFDIEMDEVETTLFSSNGKVYIGGKLDYENDMGVLTAGFWTYGEFGQLDFFEGENRIHGFVEHNEAVYAYGDIVPFNSFTYSSGLIWIGGENQHSGGFGGLGGVFQKSVRAAEVFKEHLYFAGDFTQAGNDIVNGLAYSTFDGIINSTYEGVFENDKIQIFNVENQLKIQYENLEKTTTLNLYNLQGQILKTISLPRGSQQLEISLSDWTGGMYAYQAINESGKQAGKFNVF